MLKFPLSEDIKGVEDIVPEFFRYAENYKREYPEFTILTEADKKAILLAYLGEAIYKTVSLDGNATLIEITKSGQDIALIANAALIAFIEKVGLPASKDLNRTVRNIVRIFIADIIRDYIESNLGIVNTNTGIKAAAISKYLLDRDRRSYMPETLKEIVLDFLNEDEFKNLTI